MQTPERQTPKPQSLERRNWQWRIAQPPGAVWPLIADTARFNEAAKLPKYQVADIVQADGRVLRLARASGQSSRATSWTR
jgi:hypothetical protein